MTQIKAPNLIKQAVSVTRKMAASLPDLRAVAQERGLKIHHLGAGYPHPEVTDPRGFLVHQASYFAHLERAEGQNDIDVVPEHLRESFSYTDTLGPITTREAFAKVYGGDWKLSLAPERLIPTVGATGGINLICALFERPGTPVAYITDAPTYAGFLARSMLYQKASIYSVDMDEEGPDPIQFRQRIRQAREDGNFVPFYYTVPDGHNPAGFSFSAARRQAIVDIAKDEGILIVEDAPYLYINYAKTKPQPFLSIAPKQTVHLFTGSKIGFPGPRIGFLYSDAELVIAGGEKVPLTELALTEASSDILFQNPGALRGFEALLHEDAEGYSTIDSLWSVAEQKLVIYRENRQIVLEGLQTGLGQHPEMFGWTRPDAGFFSVFTFKQKSVRTDDAFIAKLVAEYGVVVIPMYDFYPEDAKVRDTDAGYDQLRLSFCFTESRGAQRRRDLRESVAAFCEAVKIETGLQ